MRIVVMSDSHRANGNLFEIVEKHMDTADLFIFLGDGEDDFDEVLMLYPNLKYERVAPPIRFTKRLLLTTKKYSFPTGTPSG